MNYVKLNAHVYVLTYAKKSTIYSSGEILPPPPHIILREVTVLDIIFSSDTVSSNKIYLTLVEEKITFESFKFKFSQ